LNSIILRFQFSVGVFNKPDERNDGCSVKDRSVMISFIAQLVGFKFYDIAH